MDVKDKPVLTFNQQRYWLTALCARIPPAQDIVLKMDDINEDGLAGTEVVIDQHKLDLTKLGIAVVKQFGKYTVLIGRDKLDKLKSSETEQFKAKLLSSYTLKTTHAIETEESPASDTPIYDHKRIERPSYPKKQWNTTPPPRKRY